MENSILSGIQAQWLRLHNTFATELARIRPEWRSQDTILYEEAKKILSALHQRYTYEEWLPILIGETAAQRYVGDKTAFTEYDPSVILIEYESLRYFCSIRCLVLFSTKQRLQFCVYIHSFVIWLLVVNRTDK